MTGKVNRGEGGVRRIFRMNHDPIGGLALAAIALAFLVAAGSMAMLGFSVTEAPGGLVELGVIFSFLWFGALLWIGLSCYFLSGPLVSYLEDRRMALSLPLAILAGAVIGTLWCALPLRITGASGLDTVYLLGTGAGALGGLFYWLFTKEYRFD